MSSVYTSNNSTMGKSTSGQHHQTLSNSETSPSCRGSTCKLDQLFGTLGRKKKQIREVEELEQEGKHAIDGPSVRPEVEKLPPKEYQMNDLEERKIIEPSYVNEKRFQSLLTTLKNWINDELSQQRIIVTNLADDLYDGQILGKLVEKLSGHQLDVIELTQNEDLQKFKLRVVLETANRLLGYNGRLHNSKWTVEGIHDKNLVELVHLLVALVRHYRAPVRLPENVFVNVVLVSKRNGQLQSRVLSEQLTGTYDDLGPRLEQRDAIDALFTHAPEKLTMVKRSLIGFVNRHLNKINMEANAGPSGMELDPMQFSDGLLLVFLIGMLEGFFVPMGSLITTSIEPELGPQTPKTKKQTALQPDNYINTSPMHKLHNVNVAFQLLEDAGIQVTQKVRAEDIVNADLKSLLRVLYIIFNKYKNT